MDRLDALVRFYEILAELEERVGGKKRLANCDGRMGWPKRGVYFFFEDGEERADSGMGLRVVRVGTHALKSNSGTTLWTRLYQHKGQEKNRGRKPQRINFQTDCWYGTYREVRTRISDMGTRKHRKRRYS